MNYKKKLVSTIITIALLFSISVSDNNAQWVSQADKLPGMTIGEFLIATTIVVGVTVGAIYLSKALKKDKKEIIDLVYNPYESNQGTLLISADEKSLTELYKELYEVTKESPFQLFTCCDNLQGPNFNSNQTISIGIRMRF